VAVQEGHRSRSRRAERDHAALDHSQIGFRRRLGRQFDVDRLSEHPQRFGVNVDLALQLPDTPGLNPNHTGSDHGYSAQDDE